MVSKLYLNLLSLVIGVALAFSIVGAGMVSGEESTNLYYRIEKLEQENKELKEKINKIENLLAKKKTSEMASGLNDSRAWLEPKMGWVNDYTNNRIYAMDNNGNGYTMNVGIGTNTPQSRFHLVGDFYNQGFAGAKNNYNPGVPGWVNINTQTITTHGTGEDNSVVLIFAHVQQSCQGGYVDMFIRVVRDGSTVVGIADGGGFYDMYYGMYYGFMGATLVSYDEPPAGTHTYTLQIENAFSGALGYNFFVIELKR